MKVLVTGATGFIGRRLCDLLLGRRFEVIAFSRNPDRAIDVLPDGVAASAWPEPGDKDSSGMLRSLDGIVNLAGESVVGLWTRSKRKSIRNSRILGTRRLVDCLRQAGAAPSVLVSASAIGYYGDRGEELLIEASTPGTDLMARVCQEWEQEAESARELGSRVVCPRIGLVLHRSGGALGSMLLPFKLGLGGRLGNGNQWWPWIDRDDLCFLILHALTSEQLAGPVNATAPNPVRQHEFAKTLAGRLGRPAFLPAPAFVLKTALGGFATELLSSRRTAADRAIESGFQFRFAELGPALDHSLS